MNASDSGEETENSSWFLKGRTITASWNSIVNYVEVESMHKQEHVWWNSVIMTGKRKKVALLTMCRRVDGNSVGVN